MSIRHAHITAARGCLGTTSPRNRTRSAAWRLPAQGESPFCDEFRAESDERGAAQCVNRPPQLAIAALRALERSSFSPK